MERWNSCSFDQYQVFGHLSFRKRRYHADLGVGMGIQKELQKRTVFFLDVMPSSHTPVDHGRKQAAKKRLSKLRSILISHVRCQIYIDSCTALNVRCFPCVSRKVTATVMLLVCGIDRNRFGFLLWNVYRDSASF